MDLIQFRIRSHRHFNDSHWLSVGKGINLLDTDDLSRANGVLEFLSTINPPSDSELHRLDTHAARYSTKGGFVRRIIPPKKTAAIAVFTASPELVMQIADIDEDLFELDRIEVGRRLDHSRWMNFVEISSSTRWKELKPVITGMLAELMPLLSENALHPLTELTTSLRDTDRLRRSLDTQLLNHLRPLKGLIPSQVQDDYDLACRLVGRAERFLEARRRVFDALPKFIFLKLKSNGRHHKTGMQEEVDTQEAVHRLANPPTGLSSPIYLLDCSGLGVDEFSGLTEPLESISPAICIISAPRSHHILLPKALKTALPSSDGNHSP